MIVAIAAMPEMMPNATTLSTQFSGCSSRVDLRGQQQLHGRELRHPDAEPDGRERGDPPGGDPADRLAERGDRLVVRGLPGHGRGGVEARHRGSAILERASAAARATALAASSSRSTSQVSGEPVGERHEHARDLLETGTRHSTSAMVRRELERSLRRARCSARTARAASGCRSGERSAYWVSSSIACSCSGSALQVLEVAQQARLEELAQVVPRIEVGDHRLLLAGRRPSTMSSSMSSSRESNA